MFVYVGCRTTKERKARGKGIKVFEIQKDGKWELKQLVECKANPSFFCMDEAKKFLYTVHGDYHEISAFAIHPLTGQLEYLNTVSTEGENPVHLSVDKSNRWIFVANLQTGTISVIEKKADGSLGKLHMTYRIPGKSAEYISHPHQVLQDISRKYLLVSCQGRKHGIGQVVVFRINAEKGELTETCTRYSREIAEPRHLVFHPDGKWCYGVNEKDYSITKYDFDVEKGGLTARQILPTLPDTYTGDGWASGIVMSSTGKSVYVSNRKHDSITTFSISRFDGMLSYVDCISSEGEQPRFITLMPDCTRLLAANELSDTLTLFKIDKRNGRLSFCGESIATESPVCVLCK